MTRRSNLDAGGPKGRGGSGTEPEKMIVSPSRMQLVVTDDRAAVFVGREECRGAGTEAGLVSSLAFCEITVRITLSVEDSHGCRVGGDEERIEMEHQAE